MFFSWLPSQGHLHGSVVAYILQVSFASYICPSVTWLALYQCSAIFFFFFFFFFLRGGHAYIY